MNLPQIHKEVLDLAIYFIKDEEFDITKYNIHEEPTSYYSIDRLFTIKPILEYLSTVQLNDKDIDVVLNYFWNLSDDYIIVNSNKYHVHTPVQMMKLMHDVGITYILNQYFIFYYKHNLKHLIHQYYNPTNSIVLNHYESAFLCIRGKRLYD